MKNKKTFHQKKFDLWNIKKKEINAEDKKIQFREREIWWISIGVNIGFEQDGKNEQFERPVLILKKFNKEMAFVIPMTSIEKNGKYYYALNRNSSIILSQARLVSSKRFLRRIRKIGKKSFEEIKNNFFGILR